MAGLVSQMNTAVGPRQHPAATGEFGSKKLKLPHFLCVLAATGLGQYLRTVLLCLLDQYPWNCTRDSKAVVGIPG